MLQSPEFLRKVAEAIVANRVAAQNDPTAIYRSEVTIDSRLRAYANPRVTSAIDGLSQAEVTHIKLIPLPDEGIIILLPAAGKEAGAVPFIRGASRQTGIFRVRVAMMPFGLQIVKERKLAVPVSVTEIEVDAVKRPIMLLQIKRPTARKTAHRTRRQSGKADE